MDLPDNLTPTAERLAAWCRAKSLEQLARDEFRTWLANNGGAAGGYAEDEITVEPWEHSLVLHHNDTVAPAVRTRLSLSVLGGGLPLGSFELFTRLDGSVHYVD